MWVIVDVGPTQEGCSDYLSEDSRIAALMAEYAEKDEDYEGGATEDGGPPRPMLMYAQVFVVLASKHKGLRGRAPMQAYAHACRDSNPMDSSEYGVQKWGLFIQRTILHRTTCSYLPAI